MAVGGFRQGAGPVDLPHPAPPASDYTEVAHPLISSACFPSARADVDHVVLCLSGFP